MFEVEKRDPVLFERLRSGKGQRVKRYQVQEVLVIALWDHPDVRCHAAWAIGRLAELGFGSEGLAAELSERSVLQVGTQTYEEALSGQSPRIADIPIEVREIAAIGVSRSRPRSCS